MVIWYFDKLEKLAAAVKKSNSESHMLQKRKSVQMDDSTPMAKVVGAKLQFFHSWNPAARAQ